MWGRELVSLIGQWGAGQRRVLLRELLPKKVDREEKGDRRNRGRTVHETNVDKKEPKGGKSRVLGKEYKQVWLKQCLH